MGAAGDDGGSRVVRLARERRARPNAISKHAPRRRDLCFVRQPHTTKTFAASSRTAASRAVVSALRARAPPPPSALDVVRRRLARGAALARPRARAALPGALALGDPLRPRRHRHPHPHHRRRRALDVRAMATGGNNVDDARRRSHARAARALPITLITVSRGGGPAMDRACEGGARRSRGTSPSTRRWSAPIPKRERSDRADARGGRARDEARPAR